MNAQSEKNNVRTLDYYKSFVNNNILLIVGSILIYAKGIILLPIIIKNAGIAFYGRYVLVVISISLIVGIFSCGIGFKCKRFLPSAEEMAERRKLFYPPLIMQLLSIAMISVVALIFNQFIKTIILNNQFDYSITLIISILFLSVVYNMATDYFRYTHRATVFTVATTSEPYLMILFVVVGVFLWRLNTLNFFLFSYVLSLLCVTIPLFALIIKEIGFKYVRIRLKDIADDVRLGFPLVLSYIVDFILSGSDRYVIAIFMPAAAVGYYNAAYMLGSVIILIPKVCGSGVLRPLLSHAVDKGDTDVAVRLPLYMMRLYFLVGIPFITGCIVLSKPILVLIASNDVANAAHFVVPLVAVGILLYGINLFLVNILFVQQKTRVMFGINLVASLLNLILNIIFIYIYRNISVAAITTVITYLISFIMLNQKIKKYITVDYSLTVVSKAIISAFFMGISLYLMRCFLSHTISGIFLLVFINGLFYIACLFILKVFSNKELKYAREYISEFIKR